MNFIICCPNPVYYDSIYPEKESQTGSYIFKCIESIILEVGQDKFTSIISDNASSMLSALKLVNQNYPKIYTLTCFCHNLNLLVGK